MPYQMLIAEDELEEYELVLYLLKKYNMDSLFNITYASNGKQAYHIIEETDIDILLTDIEMPFSNGLQLASRVRQDNSNLPIIFFSCYDNFSFVKTALSIQACNYLLKPLDPSEFHKTMLSVLSLLHDSEESLRSKKSRIRAIKNHYLYLTLNRMPLSGLNSLDTEFDTSFIQRYTRIMLLNFDEPVFDCDNRSTKKFISNLRILFPFSFDFLNLDASQSILLFNNNLDCTSTYIMDTCTKAQKRMQELYKTKCYISISSQFSKNYQLPDAYEDVNSLIESRFFSRDKFIFIKESLQSNPSNELYIYSDLLVSIEEDIDTHNMKKLACDIEAFNHSFEQSENLSHIYVRFAYSKLMQILCKNQCQSELVSSIEQIFSSASIFSIKTVVMTTLSKLQIDNTEHENTTKHSILLVKKYIATHYSDDITLDELADLVYLNASYLSSVFKSETGCGINKFIKTIRMEKAKQMLQQTNKKISEICSLVGYHNNSYFIKSFHQYYGETPEKMRQTKLSV